jgi:c(7)-type cytochrome triheme protein
MSRLVAVTAAVICGLYAGSVFAIQPGKSVAWDTPMGKVVLDGTKHANAGLKCKDCHARTFKMKKGSTVMKMTDINAGKFCGECHNGAKAFAANDKKSCGRCHKKG